MRVPAFTAAVTVGPASRTYRGRTSGAALLDGFDQSAFGAAPAQGNESLNGMSPAPCVETCMTECVNAGVSESDCQEQCAQGCTQIGTS